jgi:signal transduction histidine kinase
VSAAVLAVADVATGLCLLGCAAVSWTGRRNARIALLTAAAGVTWFAGAALPALVFLHRGSLVHLHLAYPTGRLVRPLARVAVPAAYLGAVYEGVTRSDWPALVLACLTALAAVDAFRHTSGPARKAAVPALGAGLLLAGVLAISGLNTTLHLRADLAVALGYDALIGAGVVWLTVDLRNRRWTEATVTDLVTQLGGRSGGLPLEEELRRLFGDPGLRVGFISPIDEAVVVDEAGCPLDVGAPDGLSTVTRVEEGGRPVAMIVHAASLHTDPALLEGAVAVVRLSVANARMRAEVRSRVDRLADARRQVVEAADAQRRALTEEIARGPERRLDAVRRELGELRNRSAPDVRDHLDMLLTEAFATREELRAFAQGVRPAELAAGGLRPALMALSRRAGFPVDVAAPPTRYPAPVESAVFFLCSEALANIGKHAGGGHARIDLEHAHGVLRIRIADDGPGGADARGHGLRGIADRIEALGGRLVVDSPRGCGTTLAARIPAVEERPT